MKEYGYIEGGYLRSKQIAPINTKVRNETTGEMEIVTISIESQVAALDDRYKPVDALDESMLICEDGYVVRIKPYDNDDKISYKYTTIFDKQQARRNIANLKQQLSDSDYKWRKIGEAQYLGQPLPYDPIEVIGEADALRDQINELEAVLKNQTE